MQEVNNGPVHRSLLVYLITDNSEIKVINVLFGGRSVHARVCKSHGAELQRSLELLQRDETLHNLVGDMYFTRRVKGEARTLGKGSEIPELPVHNRS